MAFATIPETQSEFKPTEWVKVTSGIPLRLRILDKNALHNVKHYITSQKVSIMCVGEESCPICQNNSKLIRENPDVQHRQIRGFISRQNRYMVNVLNRTMVKIAPVSGSIIYATSGTFPTHDPSTGEMITEVDAQPLNRVQVLERGPTLFSQLNGINETVLDKAGNPRGLWSYDIVLMATGVGRKMTTNIVPYPDSDDVVEVKEEDLHTLETLGVRLTPDETLELLRGISLRDIFETRRSSQDVGELTDVQGEVSDGVKKSVTDLFEQ